MSSLKKLLQGVETISAAATESLAYELAENLPKDHVIALHGDLGAGKTTFIRGLARAWSIDEPVTSPTFNLYTIYSGERQLIHLDAYRMSDASDLDALMIEDFMESPWCFTIEWPERLGDSLPDSAWHLHFEITADFKHRIKLDAI